MEKILKITKKLLIQSRDLNNMSDHDNQNRGFNGTYWKDSLSSFAGEFNVHV